VSDGSLPCFKCRNPQRLAARHCTSCGASLLVQVLLARPPAPEAREPLARELSALGPLPFARDLIAALSEPDAVLVTCATRQEAVGISALIGRSGGRATTRSVDGARRGRLLRTGVPGAAAMLLAIGAWTAVRARTELRSQSGSLPRGLAESAVGSTVTLHCKTALGAGFFVAPDRIVTNAHVLCEEGDPQRVQLADGRWTDSTILSRDPRYDLAMLSVEPQGIVPLPLGDATAVKAGDAVLEIGAPLGLEQTVYEGTVARTMSLIAGIGFFEIDVRVNHGNSGGPLLDKRGRVVGVISRMRLDRRDRALALPINHLWAAPGRGPLLPAPRGTDDRRWEAYLGTVATKDPEEASRFVSSLEAPALLEADQGPGDLAGAFHFAVLQKLTAPGPRQYRFTLESEHPGRRCSMAADVSYWIDLAKLPREQIERDETFSWLKARGLLEGLYLGQGQYFSDGSCKALSASWVTATVEGGSKEIRPKVEFFYVPGVSSEPSLLGRRHVGPPE